MSDPYVPVEASAIVALERALAQLTEAHRTLRSATDELAELGEDLCIDAVRRLRERGASEAQCEAYEDGWRARRKEITSQVGLVSDAKRALEEAVARVRG